MSKPKKIKTLEPKIKEVSPKNGNHKSESELEKDLQDSSSNFRFSLISPQTPSDTTPIIRLDDVRKLPQFRVPRNTNSTAQGTQTAQTSRTLDSNAPRDPYRVQQQNERGSYSTAIRQERSSETISPAEIERRNLQRQLNQNIQAREFNQNNSNLEREGIINEERQRQYEEQQREKQRAKYEGRSG